MRKTRAVLMLLLLLLAVAGRSQTRRVLFIGNSYTLNNNLPQVTSNVASSAGDQLIFSTSAYGSYYLQLHSQDAGTLSLIRQGGWDYVVLQEYSQYPSESLTWVQNNVFPYVQSLNNEINSYNSGVETMFYMTWGRRDGDSERCSRIPEVCTYEGMDNLTRDRYMLMAQIYDGVVSPVGAVWRYLRENHPSIELYDSDGSHPSEAGTYAAACCFYTAIFRKDPTLISYNYTLGSSTASIIRNAAREVVFNNLSSWYLEDPVSYTVYASAGSGGSISPSGTQSVGQGASISFNIYPGSNNFIYDVLVDNVSVGAVSSYTFHSVTSSHTIYASFRASSYTISSSSGTGGSISPSGSAAVSYGGNRTYTITPSTGYRISDVRVDNVSVGAVNSYTFSNVTANHTITATFSIITFSINASPGSGGSISPGGTSTVSYGSDRAFTITPNTGYYISDVRVDNVSVGPVTSYTFYDVTSDHTISASFSILRYTVTAGSGTGGSVTPAGVTTVDYGSNITYAIIPATGYRVSDVRIDNVAVGAVNSYTFSNIRGNHTISASFTLLTYTINATAGSGGSISPSGISTVTYGTDIAYTITPSTGYYISDVKADNISVGRVSAYEFSDVSGNHTISASFSIITFSVTTTSNQGGTVSPAGSTTVNFGTDLTLSFSPDYGYRIKDILVDGVSKGKISSLNLNNITASHAVSVVFEPIPVYSVNASVGIGGKVSPEGSTEIFEGSDLTFTIEPDPGFRILGVMVDNQLEGAVSEYTFTNITTNHTIRADFTTESEAKIYPNPFSDQFKIQILSPEGYVFDMEVSDYSGRAVLLLKDIPGNEVVPVNCNGPEGPYFVRIYLNGTRLSVFTLLKIRK